MPITYPIDFPTTFGASSFSISLKHSVGFTQSNFTYKQQVQEHQGTAWKIDFNIDLLNRDQAEEYNAFILKLKGKVGMFTMSIPGSEEPRGIATGTPVVSGAGQTGNDLVTSGWTASQTGILKAGDWIQYGTGISTTLHKVLSDANSDGSGQATLEIAPGIKTAPADGEAIIVSNAKGLFRLDQNASPVNITPPNQHSLQFSATEVK